MYQNYFCQKVCNQQNLILSRIYMNNYICGLNISKNLQKYSTSVLYKSRWLIKKNSNKFLLQSGPNTVWQQFKTTNVGKERKELVVAEQKELPSKLEVWKAIPTAVISTQTIDNILQNISVIYDNLKKAVMLKQRYVRAILLNYVLAMKNMNVGQCFDAIAISKSNEVMMHFENTKWTYKQVEILSNKITNYFLSLNYEKGDVIAIMVTNRPEYVTLVLGLSKIGVICALINTTFKGDRLLHAIKLTDCKGLIVSEDLLSELNKIKNKIGPKTTIFQLDGLLATKNFINLADALIASPDRTPEIIHKINKSDPLIYIYTSVIANWPIAAMLPHSKFITNSVRVTHILDLKKEDIIYDPLPLYYKTGILGTGPSLICGIPVVLRRNFSPLKYWSDCAKYKCTVGQCEGDLSKSLLELQTDNENKHNIKTIVGNKIDNGIKRKLTERFHVSIAEFCDSADEYYEAQAELINSKPLQNKNTPNLGKLLKMYNRVDIKRKSSISDIPERPKLLLTNPDVPTQTNANDNIEEKNISKSPQYQLNVDESKIFKKIMTSNAVAQNNPNISTEETNVSKQLQYENRLNFDEPEIYKRSIKSDVTQNSLDINIKANIPKLLCENDIHFDYPKNFGNSIKPDVATQNNPNINTEANNIPKLLYQNDVHFDYAEIFSNSIKPDITSQNKASIKTAENNFSKPLQYENKFDFDERNCFKKIIKSDIATQKNINISIGEKKVSEPLQYENKCIGEAKIPKIMATQATEKQNNENISMEVMISKELQKSENKLKHVSDELNIHKIMIKPSSTTQNNANSIKDSKTSEYENKPNLVSGEAKIPKIMAKKATEKQNNENISIEVMISKELEKFENKLKHVSDELSMIPKIMATQATEKQNNENISMEVMISKELQKFENKIEHVSDELNMIHKIMMIKPSSTTQNNANSIKDSKTSEYKNKPNLDEPKIHKIMIKPGVARQKNANIRTQKVFKDLPQALRNLTMEDTLTPKMIVKPDVARQKNSNIRTQKVFKDLPQALRNLTMEDTLTPKMIVKPDVARQKNANIRTQKVFKDLPKALRNLTMEDTLTPKMIVKPDVARQKNANIRIQKVFKDLPKALRNLTTEDILTPRSVDKERLKENKEEETLPITEIESRINYLVNKQQCALYSVEIPGMNKNARMVIISDPGHAMNLEKFSNEIKKLLPQSARPTFIRVVDDSSTVAETFKEKLQFYKNEGFDPTKIKDKLYYINTQTQLYESLTENAYKKIIAKEIIF